MLFCYSAAILLVNSYYFVLFSVSFQVPSWTYGWNVWAKTNEQSSISICFSASQKHYGPMLGMSIEHFGRVVVTNCHEKIEDFGSSWLKSDHVINGHHQELVKEVLVMQDEWKTNWMSLNYHLSLSPLDCYRRAGKYPQNFKAKLCWFHPAFWNE